MTGSNATRESDDRTGGAASSERNLVNIIYILYLASLIFGVTAVIGVIMAYVIPKVVDIDPFHGTHRPAGQARRAARCGTSGKRRNAPGGPVCPTRKAGRFLSPAASRVADSVPHCGATRS